MIALQSQISGGTFLQNHVDVATYSGESGYFKIFETTISKNNIDSHTFHVSNDFSTCPHASILH